jgi:hypothetical protein
LVQEVDIKTLKLDPYLLIGWFEHEPAQSNALLQVLLYGEDEVTELEPAKLSEAL